VKSSWISTAIAAAFGTVKTFAAALKLTGEEKPRQTPARVEAVIFCRKPL
jgi:hypothetical protein